MKRNTRFDFGFDQKPEWVREIEREELARQRHRDNQRRQFADILGDVATSGANCLAELAR